MRMPQDREVQKPKSHDENCTAIPGRRNREAMKEGASIRDYDWWLLATALGICGIGVLEIWSATHASHLAGMHTHQMYWVALGFVLMLLVSRLDYHTIMDQAPVLYLIAIAALIAVLAVGHSRFGAKRWLPILGGFLQVSELVKLIIIVVLARFFAEVRTEQLEPVSYTHLT